MTKKYYEVVIEGHFDFIKGFVLGFFEGRGIRGNAVFEREHHVESKPKFEHLLRVIGIKEDQAYLIVGSEVHDMRTVHELLIAAAAKTSHILADPPPFVLQTALDDFYVRYELNAYTDFPSRMASIYSELHQNIQDSFNEGGVEIMSPHYSSLRDGNQTTIPEGYLAKTYTAPAFRILSAGGGPDEPNRIKP